MSQVDTDTPTVGAVLRKRGLEPGMCEEARVAYAFELLQEARRRAVAEQLDGVYAGLAHGANPDHVARRLHALAHRVQPPHPYYDCTCQKNWHPWCPVHKRGWDPNGT